METSGKGGLISEAAGTMFLRGCAVVLAFLTSVVLARSLGPDGYGTVAYVLSWVAVLSAVAGLGMDRIVVREVSSARERGVPGVALGLVGETSRAAALSGAGSVLLAVGIVYLLRLPPGLTLAFLVALPLAILEPLSRLRMAALQGLGRVLLGQVPELLIRPGLMLVGIILAWILGPDPLQPAVALGISLLSAAAGWTLGDQLLRTALKGSEVSSPPPWLALAAPLLLVQILHVITNRADIIILGMFRPAADVGVFNVAARLAELPGMALIATNFVLAPRLARAWTREDHGAAQRLLTEATRGVALLSLLMAVGLGIAGPWILRLYGSEFVGAFIPLMILVGGRLVSAAFGSVGIVLVTVGREGALLAGVAAGAATNVLLNFLLIPSHGAIGAAVATSLGIVVWNSVMGVMVFRKARLVPGPLGSRR